MASPKRTNHWPGARCRWVVPSKKTAGMKCIAVTNTYPHEKLVAADLIVDTLEAVAVRDIELLLK